MRSQEDVCFTQMMPCALLSSSMVAPLDQSWRLEMAVRALGSNVGIGVIRL